MATTLQIYSGNGSLTLRGTMDITSTRNPNLSVNIKDGRALVASDVGGSPQILVASPSDDYTDWNDITYNLSDENQIRSVVWIVYP